MAWEALHTEPLAIGAGSDAGFCADVSAARAREIAQAVVRRVLPLVVQRHGRAEPLASAALYRLGAQAALLTCRHIFDDGVALGDLGVPLPQARRVLWLRQTAARVIEHPARDLALIALPPGAARDALVQQWPAVPLDAQALDADAGAALYVLAGWPYAQMRRCEQMVVARPVVVFAPPCVPASPRTDESLRVRYARIARRADGIDVHAPELDGVSGATLWAVLADGTGCLLRPAAVQSACKHDAYARGEPLAAARAMFERIAPR